VPHRLQPEPRALPLERLPQPPMPSKR